MQLLLEMDDLMHLKTRLLNLCLVPTVVAATTAAVNAQAEPTALPPDSEYVVVNEDGHLSVNGEARTPAPTWCRRGR